MPGTLLTLRDVSLGYDNRAVLAHLSFAVEYGECLALVGPNGAGKTTLLRGILGLIPSTRRSDCVRLRPLHQPPGVRPTAGHP